MALRELLIRDPSGVRAQLARDNLMVFTRRMLPDYQPANHHWRIAAALQAVERGELDRVLIIMPPGHGKSTIASIHFPAWYLGRNPDRRIIATSYAASLAYGFSRQARNLTAHPLWPFLIGTAGDLASVQSWGIHDHRGGYYAAGVGGGITGMRAQLLILDDPVRGARDADSATYRQRSWDWYQQDALTRLDPGGAVVMVGTRWHSDDLIGRALGQIEERWHVLHLPALNEDGAALWPERFSAADLAVTRQEIGERAFTALYQGRPAPAEGGTFKRHWWKRYRQLPHLVRVEQFLDSAFKTGVGNDYSVIATWGDDGAGNLYVLDVWRQRVEYPDLIRAVHDQYGKHQHVGPGMAVVIEDKASGQSAIQTLSRPLPIEGGIQLRALPVIPFTIPAGASKESRAEGVSFFVEAGRVFLPEDADWVAEFIEEHAAFPTGAHDDQVDCSVMAIERLHRGRDRTVRVGSYLGASEPRSGREVA